MARRGSHLTAALIAIVSIAIIGAAFAIHATGTSTGGLRSSPGSGERSLMTIAKTSHVTSVAWAGYAITGKVGSVTDVRAQWHVPQIAAACPSHNTYSDFFVGIDGWASGSTTIELVGTATECVGGTAMYFPFYEVYPSNSGIVISLTIHPADQVSGEISFSFGKFAVKFNDLTTGKSFSTHVAESAPRISAEWVADDPGSGSTFAPVCNFGWVTFTNANATVAGHTHTISGFSNLAVTMWNLLGTKVKVSVGSLSSGGSTFRATWKSAGP